MTQREAYVQRSIPVLGMDCYTCVLSIEKTLKRVEGVKEARVNFLMKKVLITYDPERMDVPELEKAIEDAGYQIAYKKYEGLVDKLTRLLGGKSLRKRGVSGRFRTMSLKTWC